MSAKPGPGPGDDWHPDTISSAASASLLISRSPCQRPCTLVRPSGLAQIFQQFRGARILRIDLERLPEGGLGVVDPSEPFEADRPLHVGRGDVGAEEGHVPPGVLLLGVALLDLQSACKADGGLE